MTEFGKFGSKVEPLLNIKENPVVREIFDSNKPQVVGVSKGGTVY